MNIECPQLLSKNRCCILLTKIIHIFSVHTDSGSILVDNTTSSVEIHSLQSGATYSFRVSAIVLVNNVEQQGELSAVTSESVVTLGVTSTIIKI